MDYKINYKQAPVESVTITLDPITTAYLIGCMKRIEEVDSLNQKQWVEQNPDTTLAQFMKMWEEIHSEV
jgi:hypothetical protein